MAPAKSRRLFRLLAVTSLAFAVGACGAISPDNGDATASGNNTPAPAPTSPIDQYLAIINGTNLSAEARIRLEEERAIREEDLVAACMAEQGFTYYPDPGGGRGELVVSTGEPWRLDDTDWLEEYGFGVIVWPPAPPGEIDALMPVVSRRPNDVHFFSLSASEQEAHSRALNGARNPYQPFNFICLGDSCPPEPEDPEEENRNFIAFSNDPANWGCRTKIWRQMQAERPDSLREADEFIPLFDAIDQFRANLALDTSDADRDWAACMAGIGFPGFERRPDFHAEFRADLEALSNEVLANQEQIWHWPLRRGDGPEIEALFEREVSTALADRDCRLETDYDARQHVVVFAAEERFVSDHRVMFDSLRAAAEQLSGN